MTSYTEYHKIQSVFKRDPETKHKTFLWGEWSEPEFGYLANNLWECTEKIDGTNIRVGYNNLLVNSDGEPDADGSPTITFGGRTDAAQMPTFLLARLNELFTRDKLVVAFPSTDAVINVTLYGEGYGARIQKGGGNYIPDGVDFILFDVRVGDVWLKRDAVVDIAAKLDIKVVPLVKTCTLMDAIYLVKSGLLYSEVAAVPTKAEGLVMRPLVELRSRMGQRIITKVKAKDFDNE